MFYCFRRMSHFQIIFFKEVAILSEWYKACKTVLTVLAWAIAYLKWKKTLPEQDQIGELFNISWNFGKCLNFWDQQRWNIIRVSEIFSLRTKKYERSVTVKSLLKIHCNITGTEKLLWSNAKTLLSPSVSKGD